MIRRSAVLLLFCVGCEGTAGPAMQEEGCIPVTVKHCRDVHIGGNYSPCLSAIVLEDSKRITIEGNYYRTGNKEQKP